MNTSTKRRLFFVFASIGLIVRLAGQTAVYPGDANDNGIVNNIDVLFIGYSFGTPGPSRVLTDTDFEPQEAAAAWAEFFPGGTSYAHADANGDGLISTQDLLAVYRNYGATRPPVMPDEFPPPPDGSSRLHLEAGNEPTMIQPGTAFTIPVYLNDIDNPLELNGLAFSLEYDTDIIKEIRLEWAFDWLQADSSWYALQTANRQVPDLEVVATRFGNDPVIGGGLVGRVSIIIEDDLIGLLPAPEDSLETLVKLRKIRGVGRDFVPIPIGGNEYHFTIYHPEAELNPVKQPRNETFIVYPNPARGVIRVESQKIIKKVIVFDLLGRRMMMKPNLDSHKIQLPVHELSPGLYLLQVQMEEGMGTREIFIE